MAKFSKLFYTRTNIIFRLRHLIKSFYGLPPNNVVDPVFLFADHLNTVIVLAFLCTVFLSNLFILKQAVKLLQELQHHCYN